MVPGTVAYTQPPATLETAEPVLRFRAAAAPASDDTALSSAALQHSSSAVLLAWLVLPLLAACAVCITAVALVAARRRRAHAFQHMFTFHDGLERREHLDCTGVIEAGLKALPAEALVKSA